MIWKLYIYSVVLALAAATLGSFTYLVVFPQARLARTAYGLDRFTTSSVLIPSVSHAHSERHKSMTIGELIRYYQASAAAEGGASIAAPAISAPTGC